MPTDIDSLSLQFTADSTRAAKSIDQLASSLGRLAKNLGSGTMDNLGNLARALKTVDSASAGISVSSFNKIADAFDKLSATVQGLDRFVNSLGKLNAAMTNYGMDSAYAKNIAEVGDSFGILAEKLNSINAGKIKDLSSSIRSFAYSTTKINDILGRISFTDAGLQAKNFARVTTDSAKEIIRQYGIIDEKVQSDVISAMSELAAATRKTNTYSKESSEEVAMAYTKLGSILYQNARFADDSKKIYMDLLQYIAKTNASGAKIKLPFNGNAEFRDAYSSMRSVLGKAFTSDDAANATQDIVNYVKEMNDQLGTTIDVSGNAAVTFEQLVELLKAARAGTMGFADAGEKGEEAFNQLNYTMDSFLQSLQNVTANGGGVENTFKSLADGLQQLSGLNIPDSANLAALVTAISKFGLKSATNAPANISALSDALMRLMNTLATAPPVSEGVVNLIQSVATMTSGLRGFAGSASSAATGLRSFEQAASGAMKASEGLRSVSKTPGLIKKIADAIGKLHIAEKVSNGVKKLAEGIASLVKGVTKKAASAITNLTKKLNIFGKSAGMATNRSKGLASVIGSLYARFWLLKRAYEWGKSAVEAASDLVEVQNVVNKTFGEAVGKVEDFAKTSIENYGMSELSAKQFASRFQAMGTALGYSQKQMSEYSINLTKLAADMGSFYNKDYEDTAKALESVFTGQSKPLRAYGVDITEATLKEWALKRGMDANIESMTQAQKVMLRYQYVMERMQPVHNDFLETIDTWANQSRLLRENLKALMTQIGSTLINVFKPVVKVLNTVLKHILSFVKTVGDALGTIFGWRMEVTDTGIFNDSEDDYEPAVTGLNDIADAAKDGAKALEKEKEEEEDLTRSIMGFDEINKLTAPEEEKEQDPVGDDAAKNANDAADALGNLAGAMDQVMVAAVPTESLFESSIDTLYKLGKFIGDSLKNALDSIDWDYVYSAAEDFGTGLAEFLNGLISPGLFESIGTTVGNALNTALHALNAFAYTFDFPNLGASLAAGLKGLAKAIDTDLLKETLGRWGKGIAQTLNGLFDADTAGSIGKVLADGVNAIFTGLNEFAKEANWKKYGEAVKTGIKSFLDELDMDLIIETMGNFGEGFGTMLSELADPSLWSSVGSVIAGWLNAFTNFFLNFGKSINWEGIGGAINTGMQTLIDTIDWGKMYQTLVVWGAGIAGFLNNLITPTLGGSVGKAVAKFMNNFLGGINAIGAHLKWENLGASLKEFVNNALTNFDWKLLGTTIDVWARGFLDMAISFFKGLGWDSLFSGLATALDAIHWSTIATKAVEAIWAALSGKSMDEGTKTKVLESFSGLEGTLKNISSFTFTALEDLYNNFLLPVAEWGLGDGLPALSDIVTNQLSNVNWDTLSSGVSGLVTALKDFTIGIFDGFIGFFEELSKFPLIGILLNAIGSGLDAVFGSMDGADHQLIHDVGEAVGGLLAAIVAAKVTTSVANAITSLASSASLPALITAIVTHPAAAIIAGGAAIGLAIAAFGKSFGSYFDAEKVKDAKNLAGEIDSISTTLSSTKISAQSDYSKIKEVLDSFWTLNEQLKNGGTLSDEDTSLFEGYKKTLMEYSGAIETELGKVKGAYTGAKDDLATLIDLQYQEISLLAYQSAIDSYASAYSEAQKQILDAKYALELFLTNDGEVQNSLYYSEERVKAIAQAYADGNFTLSGLDEETKLFHEDMKQMYQGVENAQGKLDEFRGVVEINTKNMETAAYGLGETRKAQEEFTASLGDTSEKYGDVSTATDQYAKKVGEAKTIISEKANGMYTDLNAKMDDISRSLEEHGIDGTAKINAFPWKSNMGTVMDGMKSAVDTGKSGVESSIDSMDTNVITKLGETATNANTKADDLVNEYSKGIKDNQGKIDKAVDDVTSSTDSKLSKNAKDANTRGQELGDEFTDGIKSKEDMAAKEADYLASHAINYMSPRTGSGGGGTATLTQRSLKTFTSDWKLVVEEDCLDTIRNAYGIVSGGPSSVMDAIGNSAIGGLIKGVADKVPEVKTEFESLPGKLKDKMGNVFNFFKPSGEDTIGGLKQGEEDKKDTFLDLFPVLIDDARKKFDNVKHIFELLGNVIPIALKQGVYDKQDTLLTYIGNIYTSITGAFVNLSSDMYTIGSNAIWGLRNGWTSTSIPMPHFSHWSSPVTVGDKTVYIPHFDVSWYAKGALAYGPSLVGVGEAGKEAILPLENRKAMKNISESIAKNSPMVDEGMLTNAFVRAFATVNMNQGGTGNQILNVVVKTENDEVLARAVTRGQRSIDYRNNAVSRI